MTEYQRLFLVQARSDLVVFEVLRTCPGIGECHALHYLQMATEMLGKAHAWKNGPRTTTHRAFVVFLKSLSTNRKAQKQLGFERKNEKWEQLIRSSVPLAERIEDLAPSLSPDGPNPEYPWPRIAPEFAPAEHSFEIWRELHATIAGRKFLFHVVKLFAVADAYL